MKNKNIEEAVKVIKQGGIVIFPTDTVWGIGCRIDLAPSIEKLYRLRKRPNEQAAPVLVSSKNQATEYFLALPKEVEKLLDDYWPGGLTVVYKAQVDKIPSLIRGNSETIGLRMPNHKDLLYLISSVGVPILGPSANFHGEKTPVSFSDLDRELIKKVDFVLSGECTGNMASTVIDCTKTPWQVLRQGAVKVLSIKYHAKDFIHRYN
ncbi:threonylcarbamoyl-AMP synthase [Candidatus Gottesmanbacteria bacterium]|nr:threonylcarbamoyl-AMP synthase [Candidatus Gottesmanbacteria bacterium]